MKVLFLGTRGWYPKYGHTACIMVSTPKAELIFDCGTGAARLKDRLDVSKEVHLFLSHFHLDHMVGLSFLLGAFRGKKLTIWGQQGVEKTVRNLLSPPYFPVTMDKWPFEIEFKELEEKQKVADAEVRALPLVHSNPSIGFRIEQGGKSIAYITDTKKCENAVELAKGVDLLMHEATYSERNYVGSSHCTGKEAGEVAQEARTKSLVLIHNDAECDEKCGREILKEARAVFRETERAEDGMRIRV